MDTNNYWEAITGRMEAEADELLDSIETSERLAEILELEDEAREVFQRSSSYRETVHALNCMTMAIRKRRCLEITCEKVELALGQLASHRI